MRRNLKKKENSFKNLVLSLLFGVFAVAVIALLISTNWQIYKKRAGLDPKISQMKAEAELLEQKNIELNENLAYIQSEEYLEKVAREQLDLKKEGEEVIVIQKEDAPEKSKEKNNSWWVRIKSIFAK
ncbi:MAG: septum formation initiator family protein [bacterium]|nr:septum formation initiator family protein [bacterium]